MARKEDKLRPYRVDYFNIDEMKDNDLALVRSTVVRAITAAEAAGKVLADNETLPLVLIRSYRFYKQITSKKDVYKPVEDLFSEKNALIVMDSVEQYRASQAVPVVPDHAVPDPSAGVDKATFYKNNSGTQMLQADDLNGHVTRMSDSSLYDEVCVHCGATDTSGGLESPCTGAPAPTSGPDSPATVAAVADLNGFLSHDAHEQIIDQVTVTSTEAEGRRYPTADNTLEHGDDIAAAVAAYDNVFPPPALNNPMPGAPNIDLRTTPTWQKILLFAGMLGGIMLLLWLILPHK
jgi:hypothetical protein